MSELDLLVVGINVLSEGLWLAEVEWGTLYLQDLTCWDSCRICRQIEVGVDLSNLIVDAGSRISCTCQ